MGQTIKYYTTATPISIEEFIETEVYDRENYDITEINNWIIKYNIPNNKEILLWVSTKPWIAARYTLPAEYWDNIKEIYLKNPSDFNIETIYKNDGTIINESNDGDDGYLMVLNENINENMKDIRNDGRPGIDARSAELINDWLTDKDVDFLPEEVHEYTQQDGIIADNSWEFRKNDDNTIDVIFPNDVVITVDVDLNTEDISYVSDSLSTIEDKELYGDDFDSNDNVSKTFDQDFKYEHKIITTIKEFKQYLKVNDN
jgi:hypothetical protein